MEGDWEMERKEIRRREKEIGWQDTKRRERRVVNKGEGEVKCCR